MSNVGTWAPSRPEAWAAPDNRLIANANINLGFVPSQPAMAEQEFYEWKKRTSPGAAPRKPNEPAASRSDWHAGVTTTANRPATPALSNTPANPPNVGGNRWLYPHS